MIRIVRGNQEKEMVLIDDTDLVAFVDIKLDYDIYIGHFLHSNGVIDEGEVHIQPYHACKYCMIFYAYHDPEIGYSMAIKNARMAAAIVEAFDWTLKDGHLPEHGSFKIDKTRIDLPTEEEAHKILKARGIDFNNIPD